MREERDDPECGHGRRDALKKLGAGAAGAAGLWAVPSILSVSAASAATVPPGPPGTGPYTYEILNIADDPFISALNPNPGAIAESNWILPDIGNPNIGIIPESSVFGVNLGFPFRFYGQMYGPSTAQNMVFVSAVGTLVFGGLSGGSQNQCLPTGPAFRNVLLPYWDSLDYGLGVYVSAPLIGGFSSTGPDVLVISWYQFFLAGGPSDRGTMEFAVVLHGDTMQIDFVYYNLSTGDPARDNGATATVGIQGPGASDYTQVGCNPYQFAIPGPEVIGTPIPGVEAGKFIRFTG